MLRALGARAIFPVKEERRLLTEYLAAPTGTFVEVGAFQPIAFSQTHDLEQAGWTGILIEPVTEHAAALRQQRSARVFEVACGSPSHHGTLIPIRIAGGLSTLRTLSLPTALAKAEARQVRVVTLDSVLDEAGIGSIDFISIDVEGMEIDVLLGFSTERFRPRLALIEDFCESLAKHHLMRSRRYKLVRRTDINSWYVPEDAIFPVSAFGRWQLFRKYYLSLPFRWLKRRLSLWRMPPMDAATRN